MANYTKKTWLCLIIMLAIIILIIIVAIKAINTETTSAQIANNIKENLSNNEIQDVKAETGTSAKVDEIASQAKNDANSITDEIKESAVSFIKNNKENFYKDNETMEQAMYYGYLLEYAYQSSDTALAQLGQDVYQAIKYVYRGIEAVEDEATQENLRQIEKDLQEIE